MRSMRWMFYPSDRRLSCVKKGVLFSVVGVARKGKERAERCVSWEPRILVRFLRRNSISKRTTQNVCRVCSTLNSYPKST